ncbi:MAG: cyanoexosortase A [Oscillatoriophycideae cyanobacterium NC_groundwater_1537_Pr4_S-0.65um_50_18]|nr:cyanoexosortase A [Oscillatoriophycideae cyanobacterium NC_groundwater_1537_Pr4_S-0.65um_50_18]
MNVRLLKPWQDFKIWLCSIGLGLILLHLLLVWKLTGQIDQILLSGLFWLAIAQKLWRRRWQLQWQSDGFTSAIGLLLLGLTLIKSLSLWWTEASFLRLLPLLIAVSLGLLAAGWRLLQFWRELLLLLPLILPKGLLLHGLEAAIGLSIRTLTAQFSSFMLHYLGFTVIRQGTVIELPNGAVDVSFGCTSIPALMLLLQLAILFITFSSIAPAHYSRVVIASVAIAVVLSSLRIALLAIVVADTSSFSYWHGSQGSQIFSTIAILLFGKFCQTLLKPAQPCLDAAVIKPTECPNPPNDCFNSSHSASSQLPQRFSDG